MSVSVIGTGSYLPARILANSDLARMVDTSDDWIVTRTGIRERRIAAEGETTSDMGATAARRAMESAGVGAEEVGLIIVATATPDMAFPSTACLIQDKVGARSAFCFDVSAACSGFLYGLEIGRRFVDSGVVRTALIVGAEKFSSIVDWRERETCVLFGDGAGAAVIRPADGGRGVLSSVMGSDGTLAEFLRVLPLPGRHPDRPDPTPTSALPCIRMTGREVFKHAVRYMSEAAQGALAGCGLSVADVDLVIPHQANARIMQAVASRLGIPAERFYLNLERVGNMSAASVPVAMDEAAHDGTLKRGDMVLLLAFGGGFTWGASVLEW